MKTCYHCGRTLPLAAFHANKRKPDGLDIYCRECKAAASAARRKRKPEECEEKSTTAGAPKITASWYKIVRGVDGPEGWPRGIFLPSTAVTDTLKQGYFPPGLELEREGKRYRVVTQYDMFTKGSEYPPQTLAQVQA